MHHVLPWCLLVSAPDVWPLRFRCVQPFGFAFQVQIRQQTLAASSATTSAKELASMWWPSKRSPSISSCSAVERNRTYSCFMDLLCDFSARVTVCHEPLHQTGLAINTRSSVDTFLNVIPRILLALSRLVPNQAIFLVLNVLSLQLFSSDHPF